MEMIHNLIWYNVVQCCQFVKRVGFARRKPEEGTDIRGVNLGPAGPGPGGARGPHELCYLGIYGPRLADDEFKFVLSYRQYD